MPERQLVEHRHNIVDRPVRHRLAAHCCHCRPEYVVAGTTAQDKRCSRAKWELQAPSLCRLTTSVRRLPGSAGRKPAHSSV